MNGAKTDFIRTVPGSGLVFHGSFWNGSLEWGLPLGIAGPIIQHRTYKHNIAKLVAISLRIAWDQRRYTHVCVISLCENEHFKI